MKKLLLAAALTLLPAAAWSKTPEKDCGPLPPIFDGVAFSGDGDNVYGVGYPHSIRLWGINAPELRNLAKAETVPGMRARAALEDLLAASGHKVRCEPLKWDRFCRVVAQCNAGETDISLAMLKQGMAFGFYLSEATPATVDRALAYAAAEAAARKGGVGLWPEWLGEKTPIAPVEQAPSRP